MLIRYLHLTVWVAAPGDDEVEVWLEAVAGPPTNQLADYPRLRPPPSPPLYRTEAAERSPCSNGVGAAAAGQRQFRSPDP